MSLDINTIHNISTAFASAERDRVNRNKNVNQKGYISKEQMRKNAAQMTFGFIFYIVFFKVLSKAIKFLFGIPLRLFGRKAGIIINISVLSFIALFFIIGISAPSRKTDEGISHIEEKIIESEQKNDDVVEGSDAQTMIVDSVCASSVTAHDRERIVAYLNEAVELSFAKAADMINKVKACGCDEFIPSIQYDLRKLHQDLSDGGKLRKLLLSIPYEEAKAKIDEEIESVFSRIAPLVQKAEERSCIR